MLSPRAARALASNCAWSRCSRSRCSLEDTARTTHREKQRWKAECACGLSSLSVLHSSVAYGETKSNAQRAVIPLRSADNGLVAVLDHVWVAALAQFSRHLLTCRLNLLSTEETELDAAPTRHSVAALCLLDHAFAAWTLLELRAFHVLRHGLVLRHRAAAVVPLLLAAEAERAGTLRAVEAAFLRAICAVHFSN